MQKKVVVFLSIHISLEFTEQLKQNQNRRLSRDGTTFEYLLYIFDSIELLRLSVA